MPYGIEQAAQLGAGIGAGITGAIDDRESRKREAQKLLMEIQENARKVDTHERGIAKERFGQARTDAQAMITRGDYQQADEIMMPQLGNYNRFMGTNNVGDRLIPRTIEAPRPAPSMQGPMPGVDGPPDYANPANQARIERRAGYVPPKQEYKQFSPGASVYEVNGATGEMGDSPAFNVPHRPGVIPRARQVRVDNGDGTFSMVDVTPDGRYPYKPGKTTEMKGVDEAKVWLLVDKRLAASKPIPSADRTIDQRTGKPLADAYVAYEQARQAAFDKEMAIQMRMNPGRDPFAGPGGQPFNQPSRGNGGTARWAPIIQQASEQFGVPVAIIEEVMRQESGGNPNARSPVGARGLMQFMPGTAAGLGINPDDPNQAILGGARHLRGLYDKFGKWSDAIAAYNAGADDAPARKGKRIGPFARSQSDPRFRVWENPSNAGYAETRNYVNTIKGRLKARGVEISAAEAAQLAALYDKHGVTPGEA